MKEYVDDVKRSCEDCAYASTVPGSNQLFCNMYGSIAYMVVNRCYLWRRPSNPPKPVFKADDEKYVSVSKMEDQLNVYIDKSSMKFKCKSCGATSFVYVSPPGEKHYCPNCGIAIAEYK